MWIDKDPKSFPTNSGYSDQTAWMHNLIRVFAGRTCNLVGNAVPRLICNVTHLYHPILSSIHLFYRRALSVARKCNVPLMVHHMISTIPTQRPECKWFVDVYSLTKVMLIFRHGLYVSDKIYKDCSWKQRTHTRMKIAVSVLLRLFRWQHCSLQGYGTTPNERLKGNKIFQDTRMGSVIPRK